MTDIESDKKAWEDHMLQNKSVITENFWGMIRRRFITSCQHEPFIRYETFEELQLNLWDNKIPSTVELIKEYFADEGLSYTCEKCKIAVDTKRETSMVRLPPVLMLRIERNSPDRDRPFILDKKVDLNMTLDSRVFAKEALQHRQYQLSGVVNHSGSQKSGHYWAFCYSETKGSWYNINDAKVSHLSINDVSTKHSYILVYQAVNEKKGNEKQSMILPPITKEMANVETEKVPIAGIRGILNPPGTNVCYINSIMQCLFHLNEQNIDYCPKDPFCWPPKGKYDLGEVATAFKSIMNALGDGKVKDSVNPMMVKNVFARHIAMCDNNISQDAMEFTSELMNCLHKDLRKYVEFNIDKAKEVYR